MVDIRNLALKTEDPRESIRVMKKAVALCELVYDEGGLLLLVYASVRSVHLHCPPIRQIDDTDTALDCFEKGFLYPDLVDVPAQEKVPVNRYGQMHGNYLKKNNRTAYNELLFSGRLNRYPAEIGEQAEKMLALLTEQYAAAENVTEEMKAADQLGWVRAMNSIRNRAEEVVLSELVYC